MKLISIVVPVFNEEESVELFYSEAINTLLKLEKTFHLDYEIIYVDDGSRDGTLGKIKEITARDQKVKYISFSRNFGKESGIYAGLKASKGDCVATMDVDLQDPPAMLEEMVSILSEGRYDCVATRRSTRKGEPVLRSLFARMFYKFINALSDTEIVDGARDFRLMTRKMVNAVLSLTEYNRFSKGIFSWVGFETKWLEYENVERAAGVTKWNFFKLFKYSVQGITGFTTAPLLLASYLGLFFCLVSFVMIIYHVLRTWLFGNPTAGWPSIVCLIFFCSGIQLFCVGIIGEYLARLYTEVKRRPVFVVKETSAEI